MAPLQFNKHKQRIKDLFAEAGAELANAEVSARLSLTALPTGREKTLKYAELFQIRDKIKDIELQLQEMEERMLRADAVILFSAPYMSAFKEMEMLTSELQQFDTFLFNPDVHMELFAKGQGIDESMQGLRRFQIWTDIFLMLQEQTRLGGRGEVHVMVTDMPKKNVDGEYDLVEIDKVLPGGAQHGEVRIAIAGGFVNEQTGLHFHVFEPQAIESSLLQLRQQELSILFSKLSIKTKPTDSCWHLQCKALSDADMSLIGKALKQKGVAVKEIDLTSTLTLIPNIVSLCEGLKNNASLDQLCLSNNNIEDITPLADALAENTSLRVLVLSGNRIKNVSPLLGGFKTNTSLQDLDLSDNSIEDIKHLGEALASNCSLKVLNLAKNKVGDIGSMVNGLGKNTSLQELDLSENGIADITPLAEALATNTVLRVVRLVGNKIKPIGPLLRVRNNTSLQELDLSGNSIEDTMPLILAVANNNALKVIRASKNNIRNIGPVREVLQSKSFLQEFDLRCNNIFELLRYSDIIKDFKFLADKCNILRVDFLTLLYTGVDGQKVWEWDSSGKSTTESPASIIGALMEEGIAVKNIDLSKNGIYNITPLCKGIKRNVFLRHLVLNHNNIEKIKPLAEVLASQSCLKVLGLKKNRVKDILPLLDGLKNNSSLQVLDLSHNSIEDITPLVEALATNVTLRAIDLIGNKIETIGRLLDVLKSNTSLQELNLNYDKVELLQDNDISNDFKLLFDARNMGVEFSRRGDAEKCPLTARGEVTGYRMDVTPVTASHRRSSPTVRIFTSTKSIRTPRRASAPPRNRLA